MRWAADTKLAKFCRIASAVGFFGCIMIWVLTSNWPRGQWNPVGEPDRFRFYFHSPVSARPNAFVFIQYSTFAYNARFGSWIAPKPMFDAGESVWFELYAVEYASGRIYSVDVSMAYPTFAFGALLLYSLRRNRRLAKTQAFEVLPAADSRKMEVESVQP